jgi:hypothetical protein
MKIPAGHLVELVLIRLADLVSGIGARGHLRTDLQVREGVALTELEGLAPRKLEGNAIRLIVVAVATGAGLRGGDVMAVVVMERAEIPLVLVTVVPPGVAVPRLPAAVDVRVSSKAV